MYLLYCGFSYFVLRRRNSELTEELKVLSLQVQECLSETVASLCSDLARLEGANILQGVILS